MNIKNNYLITTFQRILSFFQSILFLFKLFLKGFSNNKTTLYAKYKNHFGKIIISLK